MFAVVRDLNQNQAHGYIICRRGFVLTMKLHCNSNSNDRSFRSHSNCDIVIPTQFLMWHERCHRMSCLNLYRYQSAFIHRNWERCLVLSFDYSNLDGSHIYPSKFLLFRKPKLLKCIHRDAHIRIIKENIEWLLGYNGMGQICFRG